MLVFSFVITFLLLEKFMKNIDKNPIVQYRADVATKLADIPFPAVTYCSAVKPAENFHNPNYLEFLVNYASNRFFKKK